MLQMRQTQWKKKSRVAMSNLSFSEPAVTNNCTPFCMQRREGLTCIPNKTKEIVVGKPFVFTIRTSIINEQNKIEPRYRGPAYDTERTSKTRTKQTKIVQKRRKGSIHAREGPLWYKYVPGCVRDTFLLTWSLDDSSQRYFSIGSPFLHQSRSYTTYLRGTPLQYVAKVVG